MEIKEEALTELNVEARTILAYKVRNETIEKLLPNNWKVAPIGSGPSQGANVNIIFSDRLLVQSINGQSTPEQSANQLAVIAVPIQHPETNERGVVIAFGLSAKPEGAPGPYGVFTKADSSFEQLLRGGESSGRSEEWSFADKNGEQLHLQLSYTRRLPIRSDTVTKAYSAKDPSFFRTYKADQGADILFSSVNTINNLSSFKFSAEGPILNSIFEDIKLDQPISITSQPWIVRQVYLPFQVAVLHLQDLNPSAYTKPYVVKEQTLWIDAPSKTRENGLLMKGQTVQLDKNLPKNAHGMCKVKLENGEIRYITEVANLTMY